MLDTKYYKGNNILGIKIYMKKILLAMLSIGFLLSFSPAQAEEEKEAEDAGAPTILFVKMAPLILPVIDNHGITKTVSLVVAVEVDSQEKADQVTKFSPRLTDAYLSDLYGVFSHKAPEGGVIPITYVKKRLNAMSGKILGEEVVSDVLVQVLQSRRT